jgi:lysophospholipase L1-like esterase
MRRSPLLFLLFAAACRSPSVEAAPAPLPSSSPPRPSSSPSSTPPPSSSPGPSSTPPPPSRPYSVAALGDSLTDTNVNGGKYLKELSRLCPQSRFVSFGKGGDMVNQMRRRFVADVFGGAPAGTAGFTHLIVFGGVNDLYSDLTAGRTVEKISRDLSTIYQDARCRGLKVVAVTVAPWGGFTRYFNPSRAAATTALNTWILAQRGTRVDFAVDAHPLLSCGDPDFLCPDYAKPYKDGLHFGPQGHKKLAEALHKEAFADCL